MRTKLPAPLPAPTEKEWAAYWRKVNVRDDGCWIWTAGRNGPYGGVFAFQYRTVSAPRLLWEQSNGPLPPETSLRPTCGDMLCVRPAHLATTPRHYEGAPRTDPSVRFWAKVNKNGPDPHDNPAEAEEHGVCWVWTGAKNPKGYGSFNPGKGSPLSHLAHRFAWVQEYGPVPDELEIDHFVCDRRDCVRPSHLRAVPHYDNVMRSPKHLWRRTHCNYGHPFSGENLMIVDAGDGTGGTKRRCRTCLQRWRSTSERRTSQGRSRAGRGAGQFQDAE